MDEVQARRDRQNRDDQLTVRDLAARIGDLGEAIEHVLDALDLVIDGEVRRVAIADHLDTARRKMNRLW